MGGGVAIRVGRATSVRAMMTGLRLLSRPARSLPAHRPSTGSPPAAPSDHPRVRPRRTRFARPWLRRPLHPGRRSRRSRPSRHAMSSGCPGHPSLVRGARSACPQRCGTSACSRLAPVDRALLGPGNQVISPPGLGGHYRRQGYVTGRERVRATVHASSPVVQTLPSRVDGILIVPSVIPPETAGDLACALVDRERSILGESGTCAPSARRSELLARPPLARDHPPHTQASRGDPSSLVSRDGMIVARGGGQPVKTIGYVVILPAMGAYSLAAIFLDFYGSQQLPSGLGRISYFDVLTSPGVTSEAAVTIGAILEAFGGPLLISGLEPPGTRRAIASTDRPVQRDGCGRLVVHLRRRNDAQYRRP